MVFPTLTLKDPSVTVLGEVTNRVSSRSQSNVVGFQSRPGTNRPNISTTDAQKEGNLQKEEIQKDSKHMVSKATIERNNNIIITEINMFRLLYKIYDKLKKYSAN